MLTRVNVLVFCSIFGFDWQSLAQESLYVFEHIGGSFMCIGTSIESEAINATN